MQNVKIGQTVAEIWISVHCRTTLRGGTSWHQSPHYRYHHHHQQFSVHDQLTSVLSSPLGDARHPAAAAAARAGGGDRGSSSFLAVHHRAPTSGSRGSSCTRPAALVGRRPPLQASIRERLAAARKKPPAPVHIKKPLNAFMLFMKEMRSKVVDECTLKESAAINQILGRKVHSGGGRTARTCSWETDNPILLNVPTRPPVQSPFLIPPRNRHVLLAIRRRRRRTAVLQNLMDRSSPKFQDW